MTSSERRVRVSTSRLAEAIAEVGQQETSRFRYLTVVDVLPGGAADGNALVTVRWRGSPVAVNGYLASYTPSVGDRVLVAYYMNQPVIIGAIVGHP